MSNTTPEEKLRAKLNKLHGDILGTHASNDSCIEETIDLIRTTILSSKPEKILHKATEAPTRSFYIDGYNQGVVAAFTAIMEALGD